MDREKKLEYDRRYYAAHREEQLAEKRRISREKKDDPIWRAACRRRAKKFYDAHKHDEQFMQKKRDTWHRWASGHKEELANKRHALHTKRHEDAAGRPCPSFCEVCGAKPRATAFNNKTLHFDHDHQTGEFRGWLCHNCNLTLGNSLDDPVRLRLLADYLEGKLTLGPQPTRPHSPE